MNQLAEQVERFGFRAKRLSYGITLDDISKKCGLAISTISAYERFSSKYTETRTRDENAIIIDRALDDIINEKIQETFTNAITSQKEEKVVEYSREKIGNKLRKYCKESYISLTQFVKMCNLDQAAFAPSTIKKTQTLSKTAVNSILHATGWPENYLTDDNDIPVDSATAKPVNVSMYERDDTNSLSNLSHDGNVKIEDKRYTYQDGKYYLEYTIIRKVKRMITKEQFMNEIQKEEN